MKKEMTIVMLILMMVFIGFGIVIPVLPVMITDTGANEFHLGLMLSIYSAVSFILSPFWGGLSDRIGRRPLIVIGTLGFSVSYLLFGLAGGSLWIMYASRVLGGIFSGAVTSVIVAYVADITTAEQRTKGMALVGVSIGMGFTFGPAFGGLLSKWGLNAPFFAASILTFLTFVLGFAFLKESLPADKRRTKSDKSPSRWTAFTGRMKYLYVLAFFVTFTLAGLEATLLYFTAAKIEGIDAFQVGLMFFFCGLAGALVQGGVVRKFIKNGAEKRVIVIGLVVSAAGFFLLLFSSNLVNATVFLCVFGVGNALLRPCVTSLITQKTTVGQGVASGLSSSMDSFGRITGPLLATFVFNFNIHLPMLIGGVLCLAAIGLIIRFGMLDKAQSPVETAV